MPRSRPKQPATPAGCFKAGTFLLIIGLPFLGYGLLKMTPEMNVLLTWKPVPCEVLTAEAEDAGVHRRRRGRDRRMYRMCVTYRYEAAGQTYTSSRFALEESRYGSIAPVLAAYAPGTRHTGRVNPSNPADAVLKPFTPWYLMFPGLALPWLALGGYSIIHGMRLRRAGL